MGGTKPVRGIGRGRVRAKSSADRGRPTSLRSIRFRLLLPITVAILGLATLGAEQTESAMSTATSAQRSSAVAQALTATVKLGHQLEQEIAETQDLLLRGGVTGEQLLTAQRSRTDAAAANYLRASTAVADQVPSAREVLTEAQTLLADLKSIRVKAMAPEEDDEEGEATTDSSHSGSPESGPEAAFDDLTHSLVAVAESLAVEPTTIDLSTSAKLASVLMAAEHLAAEQRGVLREVFTRGRYAPGELVELGELRGAEQERLHEFARMAPDQLAQRYAEVVKGQDVDNANRIIEAALQVDSHPEVTKVDPDTWYIAQTNALRRLYLFELEVITDLDAKATKAVSDAQLRAIVIGLATLSLICIALFGAVALAVRTSVRLRRLRNAALTVAATELPNAINSVSTATNPEAVRATAMASAERAENWLAGPADEIGEVANALTALHKQALRLAGEQALMRLDVAGVFVALSRRGQSLVQRQLQLIDEFERSETDPETLDRLFRLDHLAARMRRNEENLLVLAGGEPGRRFTSPELLHDIVRAAGAEIEDYSRVEVAGIPEIWVDATVVSDLVHLLAELLENATMYSPPNTRVQVTAHKEQADLVLTVYDQGIGMPPDQLEGLNERLAHPSMLTSELASRMGLLVVARLAQRFNIQVSLRSSPGAGTLAFVRLPHALLPPPELILSRRDTEVFNWTADTALITPIRHGRDRVRPETPTSPAPAGLPVREPGTAMHPLLGEPEHGDTVDLDPELVKARLSSLASGLAAAKLELENPN